MKFKAIEMGATSPSATDPWTVLDDPGLSLIMDRMIDGIIIVDAKGIVSAINSAAADITNIKPDEIIGAPMSTLTANSTLDWQGNDLVSGTGKKREFITVTEDGRSILLALRTLRDTSGEPVLKLIFLRDLQVFDHMRRMATGLDGGNVFKFLGDRDVGPDFEAQRRLSPEVERMITQGTRALHQGARLLLIGESGSGKTELTKYLHRAVGTPEEPFIHVNCGAIPESLFESEMFGYEKGAFTGALQTGKRGLIESAEGGTLFLDEIGEIPLPSQAKLLKFLEDGVVQRIGGRSGRKVNARVVSATNRDLWKQVTDKQFRHDLYYRLAVITLEVAPLRHQPHLIQHLVDHFLAAANRMRKPRLRISDPCLERLHAYSFPGNIRELHNLIQHLSVAADDTAEVEHLPPHIRDTNTDIRVPAPHVEPGRSEVTVAPSLELDLSRPLKNQVRTFERILITAAIDRFGSKRKAAKALGVDIGTIVRKTKEAPEAS